MNQYILETKYAVENLISILYQEKHRLGEAMNSHNLMKEAEKETFESMQKHGFSIEAIMDLDGYSSAAERFKSEASEVISLMNAISGSLSIVAGSILQMAKQGMSSVHKDLANCPNGRMIGRESLKNVIWQARNQAMHFEEGNYNQWVVSCFQNLKIDYGVVFKLGNKNLAHEVISILGWTTYEKYEDDLRTLLP